MEAGNVSLLRAGRLEAMCAAATLAASMPVRHT